MKSSTRVRNRSLTAAALAMADGDAWVFVNGTPALDMGGRPAGANIRTNI